MENIEENLTNQVSPENPESINEDSESDTLLENNVVTLLDLRQISKPQNEVTTLLDLRQISKPQKEGRKPNLPPKVSHKKMNLLKKSIEPVKNKKVTKQDYLSSTPQSGMLESKATIGNGSVAGQSTMASGIKIEKFDIDPEKDIERKSVISQGIAQVSAPENKVNGRTNDNSRVSYSNDHRKDKYFPRKTSKKEEYQRKSTYRRSLSSYRRSQHGKESLMYSALKEGQTPIHLAAASGNIELLEVLVNDGCDLSAKDSFGYTVFHRAALSGQIETLKWLHERDGNLIKGTSWAGWTALHLAAMSGHFNASLQLLELGSNVNAKDKDGWTPLYLAKIYKEAEIMELLQSWGGIF